MGSIRRSPRSNRWEARYRDPLGRQRTKTFDTRGDAKAFLASTEADIARCHWRDPRRSRTTFTGLATAWLASNPRKRPTTQARDATVIRTHLIPALGDLAINTIHPDHVQAAIDRMIERNLAPKTVSTNYGVLRAIFSWAVTTDLLDRSPCRGIRLPEPVHLDKPIATVDDVVKLADAIDLDYRVAVFLGALGLREAEVFGLRVDAIDFLRRTLTVRATINEVEGAFVEGTGKTRTSRRTISVPQLILDELAAHLNRTDRTDPGDLVLQGPGGGPVRATNFRNRIYVPAVAAAGLDGLTFHRLRHSAGYILRELGVPLEVIQKRLGHASIRTTADIYGSLPRRVDRSVAEDLDDVLRQACGADVVQRPDTTGPGSPTATETSR